MTGWWLFAFIALWIVVLTVVAAVLGVLRRIIPVLEHSVVGGGLQDLSGIPLLSRVPDFPLVDSEGRETTFHDVIRETSIVILTSPTCGPCRSLIHALEAATLTDDVLPVRMITDGDARKGDNYTEFADPQGVAKAAFQTYVTPFAFAVNPDAFVLEKRAPAGVKDIISMSDNQSLGRPHLTPAP